MTDTITLTREQFNLVLHRADLAVSCADELSDLREALEHLGLIRAGETIASAQDEINHCRCEIFRTLLAADDAQPAPAKPRAMPKWFWPLNKSNKKA